MEMVLNYEDLRNGKIDASKIGDKLDITIYGEYKGGKRKIYVPLQKTDAEIDTAVNILNTLDGSVAESYRKAGWSADVQYDGTEFGLNLEAPFLEMKKKGDCNIYEPENKSWFSRAFGV